MAEKSIDFIEEREEPINIRAFNYLVLTIFARLYERFPERISVNGADTAFYAGHMNDEEVLRRAAEKIFDDTMHWLKEEGYIRWNGDSLGPNYMWVTLSGNGLQVLGQRPVSLTDKEPSEPLIKKIQRFLSQTGEATAKDMASKLVTTAITLMCGLPNMRP